MNCAYGKAERTWNSGFRNRADRGERRVESGFSNLHPDRRLADGEAGGDVSPGADELVWGDRGLASTAGTLTIC